MGLFLLRFWPVLMPLMAYLLWMWFVRHKARKAGEPVPHFREGPVFWTVMATLGIAVFLFLFLGLSNTENKGAYTPAHLEGGKIVPGTVKQ